MNKMNIDGQAIWDGAVRIGAGAFVFFLLYLSLNFMTTGFEIDDPTHGWIGTGLGLGGIVLQLIFNRGTKNPTLWFIGLMSYVYGFSMTYRGISGVISDPWKTIPLTFVIEVGPESIFMWVLDPTSGSPFDFLSALFQGPGLKTNGMFGKLFGGRRTQYQSTKRDQYRSTGYSSADEQSERRTSIPNERNVPNVPNGSNIVRPNKTERKVIRFMLEHKQANGDWPTTDFTSEKTGVPKSTLYPTWKRVRDGGLTG